MTKALILSFLFHSLAFAGSFFLLGNNFSSNKVNEFKEGLVSVDMVISSASKEAPIIVQPAKASKIVTKKKSVSTEATNLSSSSLVSHSSQDIPKDDMGEGSVKGEEGGANLIPHPANESPVYPEKAREMGLTGKMLLQLTVNQTGHVIQIQIIEGRETHQILQDAAFSAVKGWRFKYKTIPKEPAILSLPVVFSLED